MKTKLLSLIFCLFIFAGLCACGKTESPSTASTSSQTAAEAATNGKTAVYAEDTALGEGEKAFICKVTDESKTVVFTVHTDAETVGAALMEHNLIAGDEGEFGLYVKTVNGITADYDTDGAYWAFYVNGTYGTTGVDKTEIENGAEYSLVYTKG